MEKRFRTLGFRKRRSISTGMTVRPEVPLCALKIMPCFQTGLDRIECFNLFNLFSPELRLIPTGPHLPIVAFIEVC